GNECDQAKSTSAIDETDIEDFTFLFHEDVIEESAGSQNLKNVAWSPKTPKDVTAQLAVAEVFTTLDKFDPLLTEDYVEGAFLPYPVDDSFSVKELTRWLKCRGASTAKLTKPELIKRINSRMENKTHNVIDPAVDNFKWYNKKKKELEEQVGKISSTSTLSCTDRPCSWGHGSRSKDPGLITKLYKTSTNPIRSCFSPLPTAEQLKTDEDLVIIKDNFLKSVQRLYITEPKKKDRKKTARKTSRKNPSGKTMAKKNTGKEPEAEDDFEYIFDLHLEFNYECYTEPVENVKLVIAMCKIFAKERCDVPITGPIEIPDTSEQSKSPMWHSQRCSFFPSSLSKRIFHMTPKGYKAFLREHLWQMKKFRGNKATTYGTKNEPKAREEYEALLKKTDPSVKISTTGMWTNSRHPEFSCSPDGIIVSDSGIRELLEVKCPFLLKTGNPNDFEKTLSKKQKERFCLHYVNGKVTLKRNHPYYNQIQMAMGVTETHKCHFVVWSPKDIFYEEVKFDPSFFFTMKRKMGPLFWKL
ncbi:uncharacterized protein LOC127751855, partial [Frankliniella occidentalis]|uniref:Uncharacterized protein LOC127751855 n=1 Tax=Frankliniella occidentalis TaxID=133901 RepID=A0A9C6XA06_FRAOC